MSQRSVSVVADALIVPAWRDMVTAASSHRVLSGLAPENDPGLRRATMLGLRYAREAKQTAICSARPS